MNGEVNTQNVRQYAPKGHRSAFNFEHLTVWAALCGNGLIFGPYFFVQNVNGIAYLRILNEFVFPQLVENFNNQYWEGMFRVILLKQILKPITKTEICNRANCPIADDKVCNLKGVVYKITCMCKISQHIYRKYDKEDTH